MHNILVALYRSFGFQVERRIKEDDVGDRLVWGAVGSLMSLDIEQFMKTWTPKFRELENKKNDS